MMKLTPKKMAVMWLILNFPHLTIREMTARLKSSPSSRLYGTHTSWGLIESGYVEVNSMKARVYRLTHKGRRTIFCDVGYEKSADGIAIRCLPAEPVQNP